MTHMMYNCRKRILQPPANFITYNLDKSRYKTHIRVDDCVADEVEHLWSLGIRTEGCCCGHGRHLGFINVVEEDCPKMEALGYEYYVFPEEFGGIDRKDAFVPKSYGHNYDGYIDGFQG